MFAYISYYNIDRELINKKESHVNTHLGTDHHQLITLPISKDCSNTFLERSFLYAAPCEWNKLSEHIRTLNFDCFNMDAGCKHQCIYYCYLCCDHCKLL